MKLIPCPTCHGVYTPTVADGNIYWKMPTQGFQPNVVRGWVDDMSGRNAFIHDGTLYFQARENLKMYEYYRYGGLGEVEPGDDFETARKEGTPL